MAQIQSRGRRVKFLVDECLSPSYVRELGQAGYPDSVHPIHLGLCGKRDDTISKRAFDEDRIVITGNASDFRRILAEMPFHPGAIMVQPLNRDGTWQLIRLALGFLELQLDPARYMINRVIEVSATGGVRPYALPQHNGN